MRVIHAASSYPLFQGDSTAPFMEEMLQAFAQRNHEVTIVLPRVDGLIEGTRQSVEVIGAPYAPRGMQTWGYGRSLLGNGRLRPSAVALTAPALGSMAYALRNQIRRQRPDVVHLHWVLPQGLLSTIVPRSTPVVVSVHGADAPFTRNRFKPLVRRILDRADAVVAASSRILEFVTESHSSILDKAVVIPHGANRDLFSDRKKAEARSKLGIDQSLPSVLAVGRLVRKKGFGHLIRAMGLIQDERTHLFIVGDGPERAELLASVPEDISGRIHLMGQRQREELADWFAAADVVAVPSIPHGDDVDSGPVVLMEALAASRPVVATPVGMAADIIENGVNGFLVKSGDARELASGLNQALAAQDRLEHGARETFDRVGDWRRVAENLEDVYATAIEQRQGASRRTG